MTCPACGGELKPGGTRCPVCDAEVAPVAAPRVEGSLAADSRLLTPPARGRSRVEAGAAASRDSRERSWRDEVQERVRSRRQKRVAAGLPLFDSVAEVPLTTPTPEASAAGSPTDIGEIELKRAEEGPPRELTPAPGLREADAPPAEAEEWTISARQSDSAARLAEAARLREPEPTPEPRQPERAEPAREPERPLPPPAPEYSSTLAEPTAVLPAPPAAEERLGADAFRPALSEAELADLPLRPSAPSELTQSAEREPEPPSTAGVSRRRTGSNELHPVLASLDDEIVIDAHDREPELELTPPVVEPGPVERPARALERAQAAAFDLAVFAALASVVVYFAGRAARVELASLSGAWIWVLSFLALLAVYYAGYFTGTTGQTPGKLVTGLRVVGSGGRPPTYARAAGRALTGLVGIALAGAGLLPVAFDPARRALHDRLFRTRVVRG
jgi:uncharacterized RDD family membrane protein YckC